MDATQAIRPAAVAGFFYPGEPEALRHWVHALLDEAAEWGRRSPPPKALLVPHAGYLYSGSVAAAAYVQLQQQRSLVRRVVLLGPAHHWFVHGLALPGAQAFETPLGRVLVDAEAVNLIRDFPQVIVSPSAHSAEHALEVQLPFLQVTLEHFQIVPLTVGRAAPESIAEILEVLWGGPETLFIVSSDLSHYLRYPEARDVDRATCECIESLQCLDSEDQACGAAAVNGLLLAARRHRLKARMLDVRNSGDTAGDPQRVVGYGAFAFFEESVHAS